MMAPLPTPRPPGDRPELPRVRLEVRTGAGRTVGYEFGGEEFLIGGAGACDLRLPMTPLDSKSREALRRTLVRYGLEPGVD